MMKRLFAIFFAAALMTVFPMVSKAETAIEIIDQETQSPVVSLQDNTLHVSFASGQMVYIYNVAGVRVLSIKVEGADKRIELNLPKGCYIVKVGKTVRKISIK